MSVKRIEKEIEVKVPLSVAYNQWTQFETFPEFMEGVKEVRQLDDRRLFWRASILGREVEWQAEIYEQVPDTRIAWRSTTGEPNAGAVYFSAVNGDTTKITLVIQYDPQGFGEKIADALGAVSLRVAGDLERFRDFIEKRHVETGGWRGEIREGSSAGNVI
jgi:uncharacterized membrane protein